MLIMFWGPIHYGLNINTILVYVGRNTYFRFWFRFLECELRMTWLRVRRQSNETLDAAIK